MINYVPEDLAVPVEMREIMGSLKEMLRAKPS
jgi:hypothetical protein